MNTNPRERKIAGLYTREIGNGQPIIVLHGGPDFDHTYLLPELDRLSDAFRLLYYDQRGRGKSAADVQPEDVTIESEVADIERLREHFHLNSLTLLGHSWGGPLALEYAVRHPEHVSRLILLNTAPASHDDFIVLQEDRRRRLAADLEMLNAHASDIKYKEGDPEAVAAYYRVHFRATMRQPEHLEKLIRRLRSSFTKEGVLKAREVEKRLLDETWLTSDYSLFPKLQQLTIPTLIVHGEYDHIPLECAVHIARAIPGAQLSVLENCGHFSYLECPEEIHNQITTFLNC
jgi:proline iminopeptidase